MQKAYQYDGRMGVKLRELLATSKFKNCTILGGEEGLDRDVKSVGMLDSPDAVDYLKPGGLLLTTGYLLRDNVLEFEILLRKMASKGCAGLGIKTHRYISHVPKELIEVADECKLTIFELPHAYALNEMVYAAVEAILEKRTTELNLAIEIYERFTQILLEGSGLQPIVNILHEFIHTPIWIFDAEINVVVSSESVEQERDKLNKLREALIDLSVRAKIPVGEVTGLCLLNGNEHLHLSVLSIRILHRLGFLVFEEMLINVPSWMQMLLKQSASVIGLELVRLQTVREREIRNRDDFLNDLLDGQTFTPQELTRKSKHFGLNVDGKYRIAVCKLNSTRMKKLRPDESESLIFSFIEHFLISSSPIIWIRNDYLVLLLEDNEDVADLSFLLTEMSRAIEARWGVSMSFGVSNRVYNLKELESAFLQSIEILRVGLLTHPDEYVHIFRAQTIVDLLRLIPKKDLLAYRDAVLWQFSNLPDRNTLLQTLYVYLRNQGSVSKTAEKLYLHRNTVNYRIDKCREILGTNLRDPDEALQIQLAILIDTLVEEKD